jgi:hypothetical protein
LAEGERDGEGALDHFAVMLFTVPIRRVVVAVVEVTPLIVGITGETFQLFNR